MKFLCVHSSSIIQCLGHKKLALSIAVTFHKNSLIVAWYTFCSVEIRTLTPNKFENQTNEKFKLLGHNYNHQQGHVKRKIVALYRYGFNLNLPKHFYFDRYFG